MTLSSASRIRSCAAARRAGATGADTSAGDRCSDVSRSSNVCRRTGFVTIASINPGSPASASADELASTSFGTQGRSRPRMRRASAPPSMAGIRSSSTTIS
jgi:hypothetical protein